MPLVLHGEQGFSRKSERGQASYYYSQPFFTVDGVLIIARPGGAGLGAGLDGPGVEQSAVGVRPKGVGLVLASPCKWREGDAFSPEERGNCAVFLRELGLLPTEPRRRSGAMISC